jgi:hypothetical protein
MAIVHQERQNIMQIKTKDLQQQQQQHHHIHKKAHSRTSKYTKHMQANTHSIGDCRTACHDNDHITASGKQGKDKQYTQGQSGKCEGVQHKVDTPKT